MRDCAFVPLRLGVKHFFPTAEFLKFVSMEKKLINSKDAPAPIGPYNQAVLVQNTLYISGQICIDPDNGSMKNRDIQEETHQVMKNLRAVLKEAGMKFDNVVKTTIFITDMARFAEINE